MLLCLKAKCPQLYYIKRIKLYHPISFPVEPTYGHVLGWIIALIRLSDLRSRHLPWFEYKYANEYVSVRNASDIKLVYGVTEQVYGWYSNDVIYFFKALAAFMELKLAIFENNGCTLTCTWVVYLCMIQ